LAELVPIAYLDSSALIKLVVPEAESDALRGELRQWGRHASSALARTEVVRAAARVDLAARDRAIRLVRALSLIAVTDDVLDRAAELEPLALRSLDAIHVASAVLLGDALGAAIAYDGRILDALRSAGLPALAPG
jgi:predicted nucleic acid-binding protein